MRRFTRSSLVLSTLVPLVLTVFLMQSAQAQTFTVLHTFACCEEGYLPFAGMTMDRAGNLYGTTNSGGSNSVCCGTAFKLTHKSSGWVFGRLYSLQGETDGAFPYARVIFGPDGNLYGTTLYGGSRD